MTKRNGVQADEMIHYLTTGGGRTVSLGVRDRILLGQMLPSQADITTLRVVQELKMQLSFSDAEHQRFGIKQDGNQILWEDTASTAEIAVSKAAHGIIVEVLKGLNDKKQLTEAHISLYEMFVERADEAE